MQASAAVHGLQSIHASGVAHRDLKPRHILVPKDQPGSVVFVDFTYSASDGPADSQPLYDTLRESGMQSPDIRPVSYVKMSEG
jgi:serine/threonine protein kinase